MLSANTHQKDLRVKHLKNGTALVGTEHAEGNDVLATILINAGSIEDKKTGTAHLLEHVLGDYLLASAPDVSLTGAYTEREATFYLLRRSAASDIFFGALDDPKLINVNSVAKAKREVLSEIAFVQETSWFKIQTAIYKLLPVSTVYRHSVQGEERSVIDITKDDLKEFKNRFYTPENIIMSSQPSGKGKSDFVPGFPDVVYRDRISALCFLLPRCEETYLPATIHSVLQNRLGRFLRPEEFKVDLSLYRTFGCQFVYLFGFADMTDIKGKIVESFKEEPIRLSEIQTAHSEIQHHLDRICSDPRLFSIWLATRVILGESLSVAVHLQNIRKIQRTTMASIAERAFSQENCFSVGWDSL